MLALASMGAVSLHERVGAHRVVFPRGALPQVAEILDAEPVRRSEGELLVDVDTLNVDSASFRQLDETGDVARQIESIVAARGKLHNPVTGSGGMLIGRVSSTGNELGERFGVAAGDRIATLVSLTLTPLFLDEIRAVRADAHQVDVRGTAVVFPTGALARMPDDIPERIALALFDIAGAAPQVLRLAKPGASVCVLAAAHTRPLLPPAPSGSVTAVSSWVSSRSRRPPTPPARSDTAPPSSPAMRRIRCPPWPRRALTRRTVSISS